MIPPKTNLLLPKMHLNMYRALFDKRVKAGGEVFFSGSQETLLIEIPHFAVLRSFYSFSEEDVLNIHTSNLRRNIHARVANEKHQCWSELGRFSLELMQQSHGLFLNEHLVTHHRFYIQSIEPVRLPMARALCLARHLYYCQFYEYPHFTEELCQPD